MPCKNIVLIQLTDFADEDTATDGHLGGEGALLVCKSSKMSNLTHEEFGDRGQFSGMGGLLEVRELEYRMRVLAREGNDRDSRPLNCSMRSSIRPLYP